MDDLVSRAERCRLSFSQIIARVRPSSASTPWERTTIDSWINQRTRLKVWVSDLVSLSTELKREQQSCAQAFESAGIPGIIEDLEQDLVAVLEIAKGERLPFEEQQPVDFEAAEQWSGEDDEGCYEIPERLKAIEDVIDRLFRASNSQFDRILLLQSANISRSQPWRSEEQIRDKGKGEAAQRPLMSSPDTSNGPLESGTATRPLQSEAYRERVGPVLADSRHENLSQRATLTTIAATFEKYSMAEPHEEDRSSGLAHAENREVHQPQSTIHSAAKPARVGPGNTSEEASSSTQWILDRRRRLRYIIDWTSRAYVYEDGSSIPLPPSKPSDNLTSRDQLDSQTQASQEGSNSSGSRSVSPSYQVVGSDPGWPPDPFQSRSREFFIQHRVFAVSSHHRTGFSIRACTEDMLIGGYRRLVCIYVAVQEPAPESDYCLVLPILSYGGHGVGSKEAIKHENGIIHTGDGPLETGANESPSRHENGMLPNPVRIVLSDPTQRLHPMSRINYAHASWIRISHQVHDIGMIHESSKAHLLAQYQFAQARKESELRRTQARASEALQYRAHVQQLRDQGWSDDAILQSLAAIYRQRHPGISGENASATMQQFLGP